MSLEVPSGVSVIKNQLPVRMLAEVFQNVTHRSLLNCRLVCKKWNAIITNTSVLCSRLIYMFDGEDITGLNRNWPTAVRTLLGTPYPFWRSFEFYALDMSKYCLANPLFFEYFVLNFCCTLTNLHFADCKLLSIGRLVELIAFCKVIRVVKIANCPHLFETSPHNWINYIPSFEKNMLQLREFLIHEYHKDVNPLLPRVLRLFSNLRRFEIYTDEVDVLGKTIVTLVSRNRHLRELNLGAGQLTVQELLQIVRSNLDLRVLYLHGMELPSHFPFSTPGIKNLEVLGLRGCFCDNSDQSSPKNLFYRCKNISRMELSPHKSSIDTVIPSIFSQERTRVRRLTLYSIPGDCFSELFVKTPNVTYLEIYSKCFSTRTSVSFQAICLFLPLLQVLHIKDTDVQLENPPPQFSGLPFLWKLAISRSNFGDNLLAILHQLQNLREIKLKSTDITSKGLVSFIQSTKEKLPKLEHLRVIECQQCTLTKLNFETLLIDHAPDIDARLIRDRCTTTVPPDENDEVFDFYS